MGFGGRTGRAARLRLARHSLFPPRWRRTGLARRRTRRALLEAVDAGRGAVRGRTPGTGSAPERAVRTSRRSPSGRPRRNQNARTPDSARRLFLRAVAGWPAGTWPVRCSRPVDQQSKTPLAVAGVRGMGRDSGGASLLAHGIVRELPARRCGFFCGRGRPASVGTVPSESGRNGPADYRAAIRGRGRPGGTAPAGGAGYPDPRPCHILLI